ncbi:hypothetical protein K502DRAFT_361688 [Neoconidiobolus thromboides FSU 785]|nr:hypothetical protein K502DRAFT_361688 [Neoconidiobolus thromboides FSU 785]
MSESYPAEKNIQQLNNNYHHTPLLASSRGNMKLEEYSGDYKLNQTEPSPIRGSTHMASLPPLQSSSQFPRFTEPPRTFDQPQYNTHNNNSNYSYSHRPPISLKTNQHNSTGYTNELPPLTRQHLPIIQGERSNDNYEYKPYSFANLLHPEPSQSHDNGLNGDSRINNGMLKSYQHHGEEMLDQVLPQSYSNKLKKERSPRTCNYRRSEPKMVNGTYQCRVCNKSYKQMSCLSKHEWEHDPHWKEVAKLSLPKSQQVQLMEAAHTLIEISRSCPNPQRLK